MKWKGIKYELELIYLFIVLRKLRKLIFNLFLHNTKSSFRAK